ncbi:MAG: GNAT family N-acetyltransferase [Solirubrobacteraceae bacterium]
MDDAIAETERVVLRRWHLSEADRLYDMHRRNEVAHWIGGEPMVDRAEAIALLQRMQQRQADDPRFGSWAVVERSSEQPAGTVLLNTRGDSALGQRPGRRQAPRSASIGVAAGPS